MEKPASDSVDQAMKELTELARSARTAGDSQPGQKRRRVTMGSVVRRTLAGFVVFAVAVVLPFVVLLRVSLSSYIDHSVHHWVSLALGAAAASAILMFYSLYLARRIGMGKYFSVSRSRLVVLLVIAYCGYSLLYISGANVKSSGVQETYRSLHPLLRLSVSTLILADGDAVVTDAQRKPDDYLRMGLPVLENSLHYVQEDGYVHALDLRTSGRAEFRNKVVAIYFDLVGLRTLRHVGTADHLHVSLPLRER